MLTGNELILECSVEKRRPTRAERRIRRQFDKGIAHCGANRQLNPTHPFFPARSSIDYRRQPILIGASQNTRAPHEKGQGKGKEGVEGKLCDLSRGCFTLCTTDIGVLDILRVY